MRTRAGFLGYVLWLAAATSLPGLSQEAEPLPVPPARRLDEAVDRARTKVVVLKTVAGTTRGAATGFLARPRLVVTAGHAVGAASRVTAWVNGVSYGADLLVSYPDYDLAVLGLRATGLLLKPAELAQTSAELEEGEPLVILSGPSQPAGATGDPAERLAIPAHFRQRVWLRLPNGKQGLMLKMDGSVQRGDSGSPVLRARDGQVVGVLSSRQLPDGSGVSHAAYAIPVEAAHSWLVAATRRLEEQDRNSEQFYLLDVLKK